MTRRILIRAMITGRVQGVFFRAKTKQEADRIGVKGWVKNQSDGSVEALFEGDPEKVSQIIEWCKKGPALSRVDQVHVETETNLLDFKMFDIIY